MRRDPLPNKIEWKQNNQERAEDHLSITWNHLGRYRDSRTFCCLFVIEALICCKSDVILLILSQLELRKLTTSNFYVL